jgi:hypothetical protein
MGNGFPAFSHLGWTIEWNECSRSRVGLKTHHTPCVNAVGTQRTVSTICILSRIRMLSWRNRTIRLSPVRNKWLIARHIGISIKLMAFLFYVASG